jgi:glycerol-3-phosphate dehydrogenase (NAD(P)+)
MMGSALAFPARENGHDVRLVGTPLDREIIDSARVTNQHLKFDRPFPPGVKYFQFEEVEEAIKGADFVICGVSSFGVDWFAEAVLPILPEGLPVLSVTKGLQDLEDGTLLCYPQVWQQTLDRLGKDNELCATGGPCTSYELVAHDQTLVAFCGKNPATLAMMRQIMTTDYYHIMTTTDVIGIESAVALKNGYALGIALTIGLNQKVRGLDSGLHFNSQAAVFGQAAKEMSRLLDLQGAGTLDNLCVGVGDLYVTVYGGRTREVGILLGRGLSIDEAKAELKGVTLESLVVAERVGRAVKARIAAGELRAADFPLLLHIDRLLAGGGEAALPWESFTFESAAPAPLPRPAREFPLVLAHRGGLGEYDDNAVGAFADALAHGILGAETDVRLTRDGELVMMHDPTVDRTTDGTGRVDGMTLAEATALRLKRSGENVPTFRQFCEVYRGRPDVDVEIELKEHGDEISPERLDRYVRLVHDQAAEALVPGAYAFTSFCVPTLERFRELYPDARLGLICETLTEDRVAEALRLGCVRVASRWDLSPQDLVDKLHASGLSVNLWCGDSSEIYDTVKAMGADVTTSNVPRAVIGHARAASAAGSGSPCGTAGRGASA